MIPISNNYPYWRYQQITTLPAANYVSATWQVPESNDYVLQKVMIQYLTVGGAPSQFTDIQAVLYDWEKSKDLGNVPIPLMLLSTPGRVENFVGSGKPHNTAWVNSKTIDWFFQQKAAFEIRFFNMANIGNNVVDIMIQGRNVMLPGERL